MRQSADSSTTATAHRLKAVAIDMARYHLRPLTLFEAAAFVVALVLGWKEIAAAILVWHVLRMVNGDRRPKRERGSRLGMIAPKSPG